MSSVKRMGAWSSDLMGEDALDLPNGTHRVVLESDYDALAARVPQWRDVVVDNAPARTPLLVLQEHGAIRIAAWERVGPTTGWHVGDGRTFLMKVTHWMPLPPPPETTGDADA